MILANLVGFVIFTIGVALMAYGLVAATAWQDRQRDTEHGRKIGHWT